MPGKRVLVVDDDHKCAQLMRNWLENEGYETQEAHSGAEALRRISLDQFDLVFIDFDMHDIKGDLICSMLRLEDRYKHLPIIIVTGHVERNEDIFGKYGATAVLYKPLGSEDFMIKVREYLGAAH